MLKIGEFSKLSRISIRMLRYYDEMGLLVPEDTDPFTGYRYYSESQLFMAGRITALKDMGFKLCDTAELLKCWEDRETLEQRLLAQREAAWLQAEEAARRQAALLLDGEVNETISQRAAKDILDRAGVRVPKESRSDVVIRFAQGAPPLGMPESAEKGKEERHGA